jgi:CRP-like cAMP-binding protein
MAADKGQALLKVIEKIPMFSRVGAASASAVLQACEFRALDSGQRLCKVGEPSDEMAVLLSGSLGVYTEGDVQIATIAPVAPVGEMGLITGQARSATVCALEKCSLLILRKPAFERLMRGNVHICRQVFGNVVDILATRERDMRLREIEAGGQIDAMERQLAQMRAETDSLRRGVAGA